jgi:hypothetical protein
MKTLPSRRAFLETSAALAGGSLLTASASPGPQRDDSLRASAPSPVKVVVWDEQQPAQKQAYGNFLGN